MKLSIDKTVHGEAFNFGPSSNSDHSVLEVVEAMAKYWEQVTWSYDKPKESFKEAGLLKLNCDKSMSQLEWTATLTFQETIQMTVDWYKKFYEYPDEIYEYTCNQINTYQAKSRQLSSQNV